VIDLLRRFTPKFITWDSPCAQVKNVLSKILTCRTSLLKGRLYRCGDCGSEINMYNSCADRHCPLCGGARRADWMDKSSAVLLPSVPYFQVVFTLPNQLSPLILGNRRQLYGLLFHSAWKALDGELRRAGKFQPAALMVLHTWNQQLEHHPHLHALVPGAGPSLDGRRWEVARHPRHRRRRQPYLTDNVQLGRVFRAHYVRGLRRLLRQDKLRVGGSVAWLASQVQRECWLKELEQADWNVFVQGPPQRKSEPSQVLKYLATYLTGGPLSDRRIISADDEEVVFWARPKRNNFPAKRRRGMNQVRPFRLSGRQFMKRWTLHILPRGFTKTRCYGGYHGGARPAYLQRCRELLPAAPASDRPEATPEEVIESNGPSCPRCETALTLITNQPRPSWRDVFTQAIYENQVYSPLLHLEPGRPPPT
jgi:hypothetical protein